MTVLYQCVNNKIIKLISFCSLVPITSVCATDLVRQQGSTGISLPTPPGTCSKVFTVWLKVPQVHVSDRWFHFPPEMF